LVQNVGRRDFSHGNSFRSELEDHPLIDHAMPYSERRLAINQEVDVVLHDLGPEQDAVRFVSDFGTDLLEPPLDAIDQHLGPIFPTKDHS
jgi:hypothetical protein